MHDVTILYSSVQAHNTTSVLPITDDGRKWCRRRLRLEYDEIYSVKGYTPSYMGNLIVDMLMDGLKVQAWKVE